MAPGTEFTRDFLCRDRSAAARRCACYAIFSLRSFIRASSKSLKSFFLALVCSQPCFMNLIFAGNWRNAALRIRFKGRGLSIVGV